MRETVFWDGGLHLPSSQKRRRKISLGPIMWVAPLAVFAGIFFYDNIAALFVERDQGYMSADNPWAKDYQTNRPQALTQGYSGPTYFRDCRSAKAAGFYNIPRHHPAYRPQLDADNDGLACEPYRGR
jgi:hypothetical protein